MTEELKVAATVPYSGQQVPVRLTVRHLDGRAIVAIGEWPHQKHAEVNPAELIDALTVQEPAHGC